MTKRPLEAEFTPWSLVVICGSFMITLLNPVITRCAGVLFISFQNAFDSTAAQTGAISSVTSAMAAFGCTLGGVLVNRFSCRWAAIVGGLLYSIGIVGGSMAKTIYQMYALGAIAGLGNGTAFTAALVIVAQYFTRYYSMVNAFTTAGISVGMLAFPPLIQLLLDSFGWRGTLLVAGAIVSNTCVAGAAYRPRRTIKSSLAPDEPNQEDTCSEVADGKPSRCAKRNPLSLAVSVLRLNLLRQSYCLVAFCFSKTVSSGSYGCFILYLVPRATKSGIHDQRAAFLISIVGISNLVGRVLSGLVNQKISSVVIYQASMLLCTCAILVAQGGAYTHFAASCAIFGTSIGFQHAVEKVMVREFVGVDNMASAFGIFYFISGFAELIAPIFAGALYDVTDSYPVLFYVFAAIFFLGFLGILTVPLLKRIEPVVKVKDFTKIRQNEEGL